MVAVRYIFKCHHCDAKVSANEKQAATTQRCPHCGKPLRIPTRNEVPRDSIKKYKKETMHTQELLLLEKGKFILPKWVVPASVALGAVIILSIVLSVWLGGRKKNAPNPAPVVEKKTPQPTSNNPGVQNVIDNGSSAAAPSDNTPKLKDMIAPLKIDYGYYRNPDIPLDADQAPEDTAFTIDLTNLTINGQYVLGATPSQIETWLGAPKGKGFAYDDNARKNFLEGSDAVYYYTYSNGLKFIFGLNTVEAVDIQIRPFTGKILPYDAKHTAPDKFQKMMGPRLSDYRLKGRYTILEYFYTNGRSVTLRWRDYDMLTSIRLGPARSFRKYTNAIQAGRIRSKNWKAATPATTLTATIPSSDIDVDFSTQTIRGISLWDVPPECVWTALNKEVELFPKDHFIKTAWITNKPVAAFFVRSLGIIAMFDNTKMVGLALGPNSPKFLKELAFKKVGFFGGSVGATVGEDNTSPEKIVRSIDPAWILFCSGGGGHLTAWPQNGRLVVADLGNLNFLAVLPASESRAFREWLKTNNLFSGYKYYQKGDVRKPLTPDLLLDDTKFVIPSTSNTPDLAPKQ